MSGILSISRAETLWVRFDFSVRVMARWFCPAFVLFCCGEEIGICMINFFQGTLHCESYSGWKENGMVCTQSSFQRRSPGEYSEYFEMMYEYWMSPVSHSWKYKSWGCFEPALLCTAERKYVTFQMGNMNISVWGRGVSPTFLLQLYAPN